MDFEEYKKQVIEHEENTPDFVIFDNVRKVYHVGEVDIEALHDASFNVKKGELVVVVGESGAGKTTLLNILGGMYGTEKII